MLEAETVPEAGRIEAGLAPGEELEEDVGGVDVAAAGLRMR